MPTVTHTNPGTVDPANQAFPAAGVAPAAPTAPASAASVDSSGELQLPRVPGRRAAASTSRGLPAESTGESQRPQVPPAAAPTCGPQGLPAEVRAGDGNPTRAAAPVVAETTKPPRNVLADGGKPGGGLPVNVMIR